MIMKTTTNLVKIDSYSLADFILKNYGPMSHLKLQKLLFYCDAYHLAYFNEELISDKFEAWVHGPVSRKIYDRLKDRSKLYSDLSFDTSNSDPQVEFNKLTSDQQDLISQILGELSTWSGLELESATHREKPWISARQGCAEASKCTNLISKDLTLLYYSSEING